MRDSWFSFWAWDTCRERAALASFACLTKLGRSTDRQVASLVDLHTKASLLPYGTYPLAVGPRILSTQNSEHTEGSIGGCMQSYTR